MGSNPTPSATHLAEIDALRGIAALIVAFWFHIYHLLGVYRTGPLDGLPVFSWFHDHGWTMVDLFFVISGFIFSRVYLVNGRVVASVGEFAGARFARLYPLHLATLVVVALVYAAGTPAVVDANHSDAWHFVLNLLMLQESGLNSGFSFNAPSWSVSVEVLCYALFFAVASRLPRALVPVAVACAAVGFVATIGTDQRLDNIARGLCGFFAGVLAFRWRAASPAVWLALFALGAVLATVIDDFSRGALLALTCWPALVVLAPRIAPLRARVFAWLGDRSYSIYLLHSPLYLAVNVLVFAGRPVPPEWAAPVMVIGWVLLLICADASYRGFERPARRWLRSRWTPARFGLAPA